MSHKVTIDLDDGTYNNLQRAAYWHKMTVTRYLRTAARQQMEQDEVLREEMEKIEGDSVFPKSFLSTGYHFFDYV